MKPKIPPPIVGLLFIILMWAISTSAKIATVDMPFLAYVALLILILGLGVNITAVMIFRKGKTTINPLKPETASQLMRSGIYKFTRNPMYLGMLLILIAWTFWLGNLINIAVLPLFVLYINKFQIIPEEQALTQLFGNDFTLYKSEVRRWI